MAIPQATASAALTPDKNNGGFPTDFQDPANKQLLPYNLQYAKAAYGLYVNDNTLITSNRRIDYVNMRLYAEGNQDNSKYKKWFTAKGDTTDGASYVDLDYTPVSPIPKYRDIVLGLLEKQDYEIDISAIDPSSDKQRDIEKYKIWATKQLDDILKAQGLADLAESGEEVMPETKEELDIYMSTFKLSTEMAMQSVLDLTMYRNDWPEIAKMIRADLFDLGVAGCREYVTKEGLHKIRYVDPVNLFVRKTRRPDCKGSNSVGEIIEMTLSELVADAGDQFTPDEYKKICEINSKYYNNPPLYYSDYIDTDSNEFRFYGRYGFLGKYGDLKVKIFDLCWFTVDEQFYEQKTNAVGDLMTYQKPYGHSIKEYEYTQDGEKYYRNEIGGKKSEISKGTYYNEQKQKSSKPNRSVVTSAPVMVYGCKWVVGTDFAYDYGMTKDIPREKSNLRETNLPYHLYRLSNKSYVERMMPFADGFMLSWTKLQNAKAKARPNGSYIELGALENMSIAGKQFTPLQALSVFEATGNLIYKGTGINGDATRHRPIEAAIGGMGQMWQELVGDMNFNIESIRGVTGFNEIFDASAPQKGQSVAGTQIALNATANSLEPMISGYKSVFSRMAKSSCLRFQMMSKYQGLQGLEYAIGDAPRKIIEISEDMSLVEMGLMVKAMPSQEEKAEIKAAALQAFNTKDATGAGQITYPDYLFVMQVLGSGNIKYAEQVLAYRMDKRAKEKQAMAERNSQVNGQIQQQSQEQAAQIADVALTKEHQFKLEELNVAGDVQIRVNEHKYSKMGETEIGKQSLKNEASGAKDMSDIQKKIIESRTKIATTKDKVEK